MTTLLPILIWYKRERTVGASVPFPFSCGIRGSHTPNTQKRRLVIVSSLIKNVFKKRTYKNEQNQQLLALISSQRAKN